MLVQKISEQAGQTGWADVCVKVLVAMGVGMGCDAVLPASKKAAVAAGMIPGALGALSILTNGQWGMVTTGSAHIATGPRRALLPARVGVVAPSGMGV